MDTEPLAGRYKRQLTRTRRNLFDDIRRWIIIIALLVGGVFVLKAVQPNWDDANTDREPRIGQASAEQYQTLCETAAVEANFTMSRPGYVFRSGERAIVVDQGPPQLVDCPFQDRRGQKATLRIAARCTNIENDACVTLMKTSRE